jgi:hypothetical protein
MNEGESGVTTTVGRYISKDLGRCHSASSSHQDALPSLTVNKTKDLLGTRYGTTNHRQSIDTLDGQRS